MTATTAAKPAAKKAMPPASRTRPAKAAAGPKAAATPASSTPPVSLLIPLEQLHRHPDQPRGELTDLEGLAESIEAVGLLQRPVVEEHGDGYAIVAGHRRVAALRLLKRTDAWCDVRPKDTGALAAMLVENDQRVGLTALEEARGYQQLVDDGLSQRAIASKVGRNQSHISKRLSLLALADPVAKALAAEQMSVSDALTFSSIDDQASQVRAYERFTSNKHGYGAVGDAARAVEAERDEISRDAKIATAIATLEAEGVTYGRTHPGWGVNIADLHKGTAERERHSKAGCLLAYVNTNGDVSYFCVKARSHVKTEPRTPAKEAELRDARERKTAMAARQAAASAAIAKMPGNVDVKQHLAVLALQGGVHNDAGTRAFEWLKELGLVTADVLSSQHSAAYYLGKAKSALFLHYSAACLLGHWESKARDQHRAWTAQDALYLNRLAVLAEYSPTAWERERLTKHVKVGDVDAFLTTLYPEAWLDGEPTLHDALGTEPATA